MRNQFPGTCYRCGERVEAGAGHFERMRGGGWRVQHAGCAVKYRGKKGPAELREIYNRQMLDHPGADMPCPTCCGSGEIKTPYGWGDCHCRRRTATK